MLRFLVASTVALTALAPSAWAQSVLVSPSAVIFEDGQRGAQLSVGNTGDAPGLYEIDTTYFHMQPDGSVTEVVPPFPENNAGNLIRFSPRQFEVPPGSSQTVRIATRLPQRLPPGEYRMHLRVTSRGAAILKPTLASDNDDAVTVQIPVNVARNVRLVVRHGVSAGRASLTEFSARRAGGGQILVSSEFARSGEGSSKGSYRVYTKDPSGAVRDELVNHPVVIYSELPRRSVEDTIPASAIRGGVKICVAYRDETAGDGGEEERCVRPG